MFYLFLIVLALLSVPPSHAATINGGGSSGGSGAPPDATYVVISASGGLSAEVAVGATDDATLVGNGSTLESKVLPSCSNATTSKLLYNSTTNAFSCGTDQDSGAGSGMTHPQSMARVSIGF